MKRVTINALVDIGCLITFIPSLISGLVLYLFLPSASGGAETGHPILVLPGTSGSRCTITGAWLLLPCSSSTCSCTGNFSGILGNVSERMQKSRMIVARNRSRICLHFFQVPSIRIPDECRRLGIFTRARWSPPFTTSQ